MSAPSAESASPDLLKIYNPSPSLAPGVTLTPLQIKHVGVVLDLFQGKGTRAKIWDNFVPKAVYEDPFASCGDREELAGQLLGIPLVTLSTETISHSVTSASPVTTTDGAGASHAATRILLKLAHDLHFKPAGTMKLRTTVVIDSTDAGIVRFSDRPEEEISDNSFLKALRKFNGLVAPAIVVPSNEAEDKARAIKYGIGL
ncbi:hypothetical protein Q5752_001082 [Cryptotrichosporon argae]